VIGSNIVFYSPVYLYDLITGLQVPDFSITWPKVRFFVEPFYSFTFYLLTLNRDFYKPIIISWILWVLGSVLVYCLASKKKLKQTANAMFYSLMILLTIFSFSVLIPMPGPKLEKPKGYIAIDTHSHTLSSHDNIAPACISLKAHIWHGFDSFFNTEHDQTKGFMMFPKNTRYTMVYPGIQVQTEDGVSVVLLALKEFNGQDYKKMKLVDVVKKAHKNQMLVIMPHWWKWRKHTFAKLKDIGIDGFEIYNCGYRYFDKNEQKSMINFAKENNLMMLGTTDWHGWGCMCDVWTVFSQEDNMKNIEALFLKNPKTKVILYRQEQSKSIARFVFEPFFAFYYYIKNINFKYLVSLVIWIVFLFFVLKSYFSKFIKKYLPLALSIIYALGSIYFYIIVVPVSDTNKIVMNSVVPALMVFCALWLVLWFNNKTNNP
jgi:hypothetical protein